MSTAPVFRSRTETTAHAVARRLAGMTARTFIVRRYDARTWEVVPQRRDVSRPEFNAYVRLATALKSFANPGDN